MQIYKYEIEFTGTKWFGLKHVASIGILQTMHEINLEKDAEGIKKHLRKAHGIRNVTILSLKKVPNIPLSAFTVTVSCGLREKPNEDPEQAKTCDRQHTCSCCDGETR